MSERILERYHRRMRRLRLFWRVLTVVLLPVAFVGALNALTPDAATNLADAYTDRVAGTVTLILLVLVSYAVAAVWFRRPERLSRAQIAGRWLLGLVAACWVLLLPLSWFVSHRSG